MPGDPIQSTQSIPPWKLPNEGSEPQEPEAPQQPPQENNQVIQKPAGKASLFKEIAASFILIFLPHWFFYLAINFYDRVDYSLGFSGFPFPPINQLPPINDRGAGWISLNSTLIGLTILLFFIYVIYRLLRYLDKPRAAKLFLSAPLVIFLLILSIMIVTGDEEQRLTKFGLSIILFIYVIATYLMIFISNLILSGVKKYNLTFSILLLLFVMFLVLPFFVPKFFIRSYEDRIVKSEKAKITKVTLKKEEITKADFDSVDLVRSYHYNYDTVERRASGEVVLAKIEGSRFLVQGIIQRSINGDYRKDRAELFVEENRELRSITEGVNFIPLHDHLRNRNGVDLIISPSKDKIAFVQRDFYIINLDGSGIYIDEGFCPWICYEYWGKDGYIYVGVELEGRLLPSTYWKVTPPK